MRHRLATYLDGYKQLEDTSHTAGENIKTFQIAPLDDSREFLKK